jgi:hypothetical protein
MRPVTIRRARHDQGQHTARWQDQESAGVLIMVTTCQTCLVSTAALQERRKPEALCASETPVCVGRLGLKTPQTGTQRR